MTNNSKINFKLIIENFFAYYDNKTTVYSEAPKTSETEKNESGFCSLQNITSENSQADNQQTNSENSNNDFDKRLKAVRKNKFRRDFQESAENLPRIIRLARTLRAKDIQIIENRQSRRYRSPEVCNQISMEVEQENNKNNLSKNKPQNTFAVSTPVINQLQQSPSCSNSANQEPISPINKPLKNPRRSLYDIESPGNSLPMQVVQEHQSLEHTELSVSSFSDNSFISDITEDVFNLNSEKFSKFWIKCCDFTVSLDVNYNERDILLLQHQIFSQERCKAKDLHFGIDNHKFSTHDLSYLDNTSTCMPQQQKSSKYWFLTGDTSKAFTGKYLSSEKILRIFQFLKASVEESGVLSFGVDDVEFSKVPEFLNTEPCPHPNAVSDLDRSDSTGEDFKEIESQCSSFSSFDSNDSNLELPSITQMLAAKKDQHQRLSLLQQDPTSTATKAALNVSNDKPEYLNELQSTVAADISNEDCWCPLCRFGPNASICVIMLLVALIIWMMF